MKSTFIVLSVYVCVAVLTLMAAECSGGKHGHAVKLKSNFHRRTCRDLEDIVREITFLRVSADPTLAPKLLRLHYHDCFVRGCDGSILLDPIVGEEAVEKEARPNLSLSGYEVIDEIKAKLEKECPKKVSCADILALAARDAVSYQFGRSMWKVLTGRRDGRTSKASEVAANLPAGSSNFTTLATSFSKFGLNVKDLVALSGAHTIGVARCVVVNRRLSNFTGKGDTDPSMDPVYAASLKARCSVPGAAVEMDPTSSLRFDSHYFVGLDRKRGLFQSDAALLTNPVSARIARSFESRKMFFSQFARSMVKMGAIGALTGQHGEIRTSCRVVN